jgi:predicted NAD-dependent protein-ADP-ribosyltransferase YbiA (DUF1768 family)
MFNTMHQDIKTSETATHVFFLNGPFSQWHPSRHLAKLSPDGPLIEFNCAEQHMMAGKADLMGDDETLRAILAVEQDPRDWRRAHGPTLADDAFGSKHLVEGAHYDRVWGVGLAWDDPAIVDPDNWNGQNRLGETLVEVRRRLDGWGGRRR